MKFLSRSLLFGSMVVGASSMAHAQPLDDGSAICGQLEAEARASASASGLSSFDRYQEIFNREKGIATILLSRARTCQPGANINWNSSFHEVLTAPKSECERLDSQEVISELETRLHALKSCNPKSPEFIPVLRRSLGLPATIKIARTPSSDLPTLDPSKAQERQSLCQIIGLDNKFCRDQVDMGIRYGAAQLEQLCRVPATALASRTAGNYNEGVLNTCGADVIQDVCGKFTLSNIQLAQAATAGEISLAKALQDATIKFANDNIQMFNTHAVKCIETFAVAEIKRIGTEELQRALKSSAEHLGESAFGRGIQSAEGFMKNERVKAIIARVCTLATDRASSVIGSLEESVETQGCSNVLSFNKQRVAACLQTTRDLACDTMAGNVHLAAALHLENNASLARTFADLASGVLENGCRAGGAASSAACSVIAHATGYITDSFRGQSNPWANCAGTPAVGVCLSQKWREYSTGVLDADYTVGRDEPQKQPDGKYQGRVCLCKRRCVASEWGSDKEIYRGYSFRNAEKGEAGNRICASQNYEVRTPNGMTYGGGKSTVYVKFDSCEVVEARGDSKTLQTPDGKLEVLNSGEWRSHQMSKPGSCGGLSDQGI